MSNPDDLEDGLLYDYQSDTESNHIKEVSPETADKADEVLSDRKRAPEDNASEKKLLSKRQKKLGNSSLRDKKKELFEYEIERRKALAKSSPEVIVDYFAALVREKNPNLSALELDDLYFKKSDFISTEKFEKDRSLTNFPDFVSQFTKAPRALILSMSNMRVADIFRSLNGSKNCVKLFSKNKLKDDLAIVERVFEKKTNEKTQNIKYFISTPTRINKIFESSELFFQGKDKLDVILDASYLDPKKNTLLSSDNTMILCQVLKLVLERKSSVKILLY
ncbi:hypothetical protein HG536_0E04120 [Torulaspora globosa]|uniref:Protein CMS1 n=1 Tax=Torulaspora globosa TaxID=48254 RepID=A0A7G3ZJ15_9SACH|nr:uncharacterized protein HG536_0E04120 [Torulaspora globosa]QLL33501.1 hypothetical protein HG536_0E04120 [Torulaspora globosa]